MWPLLPTGAFGEGVGPLRVDRHLPEYVNVALLPALAVHKSLGADGRWARLRHLSTHLRAAVTAALPRARFYTGDDAAMGGWITTIELPGIDPELVQRRLLERDRILVQPMAGDPRSPEVRGLRVTPNVFTTPAALVRFVTALKAAAGR